MPNWVTNRIVFHGNQENIDKVLQYIKGNGSKIDFNKIIPMPDNIYRGDLGKRERELYGSNNWYDWSVANWGTKWNAQYSSLNNKNNSKAKAGLGSAIVIAERGVWNGKTYPLINIKAAIVDGEKIKADTWYTLKNGEFVECD